jgi:hypothetical protein
MLGEDGELRPELLQVTATGQTAGSRAVASIGGARASSASSWTAASMRWQNHSTSGTVS